MKQEFPGGEIGGAQAGLKSALALGLAPNFEFPRSAKEFETQNVGAVAPHFAQLNAGPAQFSIDPDAEFLGFRHSRRSLGQTPFDYFEIRSAGHRIVSTRPHASEYFIFVPIRGTLEVIQGRHKIGVAPGQIALVSCAGSYTQKRYRDPTELLVIQISRQMLMKTLSDEYGVLCDPLLEFEPRIVTDLAKVPTLGHFIGTLCRDMADGQPCVADPATARACERTLILLTVQSFPHNMSRRLAKPQSPAAPYYVRRVQDFVRANAARVITAAELAATAGVSARSLYYGFQRYLGVTPMKYLKHVRLDSARAALRKARNTREKVTQIAFGAGYSNLSRFCRDYRAQFGETPSETMRRG